MQLEEAIDIKETELEGTVEHADDELRKANELLFEAGRRIENARLTQSTKNIVLLPGETKD